MPTPEEEAAKRAHDAMVDIVAKTYDRAIAYTNLIMVGGYAGAFTIWNFVRNDLTSRTGALVALLLGISLATFIFFETYKMVWNTRATMKQRALLVRHLPPSEFLRGLDALAKDEKTATLKYLMPIWMVVMVICVVTALVAVGILFWNLFVGLLDVQRWP